MSRYTSDPEDKVIRRAEASTRDLVELVETMAKRIYELETSLEAMTAERDILQKSLGAFA